MPTGLSVNHLLAFLFKVEYDFLGFQKDSQNLQPIRKFEPVVISRLTVVSVNLASWIHYFCF